MSFRCGSSLSTSSDPASQCLLGVLGAALYSIGIPKNQILSYETAIKSDKFVLVLHGSAVELDQARDLLANSNTK